MTKLQYQQEHEGLFVGGIQRYFSDEIIDKICTLKQPSPSPGKIFLGVDVARTGGDETVLISLYRTNREKLYQSDMEIPEGQTLTDTARLIIHKDKQINHKKIYIDTGGLGIGVYDILKEDEQTKSKIVSIDNARRFIDREKGQTEDRSVHLDKWRDSWPLLIAELAASGNPFVEDGQPNSKGETKPVMTGYGRNIASAARGVIEFNVATEGLSFREIQTEVQKARQAANPSDIRNARIGLTESINDMRKRLGSEVSLHLLATALIAYVNEQCETYGTAAIGAIILALDEVADLSEYITDIDTDADAANDNDADIAPETADVGEVAVATG